MFSVTVKNKGTRISKRSNHTHVEWTTKDFIIKGSFPLTLPSKTVYGTHQWLLYIPWTLFTSKTWHDSRGGDEDVVHGRLDVRTGVKLGEDGSHGGLEVGRALSPPARGLVKEVVFGLPARRRLRSVVATPQKVGPLSVTTPTPFRRENGFGATLTFTDPTVYDGPSYWWHRNPSETHVVSNV